MGCRASSSQVAEQSQANAVSSEDLRARLRYAKLGESPDEIKVISEDYGHDLIEALRAASIKELLAQHAWNTHRSFSMSSEIDADLTTFKEKNFSVSEDAPSSSSSGIGVVCRKGKKRDSQNQDAWCMLRCEGRLSLYAVFDGHGADGHNVSDFVKEMLPKLILRDKRLGTPNVLPLLRDCFRVMQTLIGVATRAGLLDAQFSGTTCTLALHDHKLRKVFVAWLGDSSGCLGRLRDNGAIVPIATTWDHKPELSEEKERIESNGGEVRNDSGLWRVYAKGAFFPGLNMSRSFGDLVGQGIAGFSSEPSISENSVGSNDSLLLLCSDGVWEYLPLETAVQFVHSFPVDSADQAADALVKEALRRRVKNKGTARVDDMTALLVFLKVPQMASRASSFSSSSRGRSSSSSGTDLCCNAGATDTTSAPSDSARPSVASNDLTIEATSVSKAPPCIPGKEYDFEVAAESKRCPVADNEDGRRSTARMDIPQCEAFVGDAGNVAAAVPRTLATTAFWSGE